MLPAFVCDFKLLGAAGCFSPCQGIRRQHLVEDLSLTPNTAEGFSGLVRMAQRTLERKPYLRSDVGHWDSVLPITGCLAGHRGVSGVLGRVGDVDVLWHKSCTRLAGQGHGVGSVPRCAACKKFYRRGVSKRASTVSMKDVPLGMNVSLMGTAQKVSGAEVLLSSVERWSQ